MGAATELAGAVVAAEAVVADQQATARMAQAGLAMLHSAGGVKVINYSQVPSADPTWLTAAWSTWMTRAGTVSSQRLVMQDGKRQQRVLRVTKKRDILWTEGISIGTAAAV